MKGFKLSEINWQKAHELIQQNIIIVLPAGAGSKEHGSHLPCGTDLLVVEELATRVAQKFPVLLLPALAYGYYPAFVDWPGSVSLNPNTFMDCVKDIFRSFAQFGAKKFLIIDGGVSTHPPLRIVSSELYNELGVRVGVTNILGLGEEVKTNISEQEFGGHGDELETSCLLAIRPDLVEMEKAVFDKNFHLAGTSSKEGIIKVHLGGKMVSKSGIHGNATLATAEKGEQLLQAMTQDIITFLTYFSQLEI